VSRTEYLHGNRASVRAQSVAAALQGVLDVVAASQR
jgi:hypothetical protein